MAKRKLDSEIKEDTEAISINKKSKLKIINENISKNGAGDDYNSEGTNETINVIGVEEVLDHLVSKSSKISKKLSWDLSVVDNEGRTRNNKEVRLNDMEAIEIFEEAVGNWRLELFKQAKEKSKDFVKLVDYFNYKIYTKFWRMYYKYVYCKIYLDEMKMADDEIQQYCKREMNKISQDIEVFVFLIGNVPHFFEELKSYQYDISRSLRKNIHFRHKDFLKAIELKMNEVNNV